MNEAVETIPIWQFLRPQYDELPTIEVPVILATFYHFLLTIHKYSFID